MKKVKMVVFVVAVVFALVYLGVLVYTSGVIGIKLSAFLSSDFWYGVSCLVIGVLFPKT